MNNESFGTFAELLKFRATHQKATLAFRFLTDGDPAVIEWTYADLDSHARSIGRLLSEEGALGCRVLLLYPPGLEYIAALFGCFYAGAVAVPAYPPRNTHHLDRLRAIQKDSDAKFILTTESTVRHFALLEGNVMTAESKVLFHEARIEPGDWAGTEQPSPLALIQYTSASTGMPKGVKISHRNLLHNSELLQASFGYSPRSVCVSWLPIYHDMGLVGGVLQPLYGGFPCTLMSPIHFLQRPSRWLEVVTRYGATISGGPNFAFDLCVRRRPDDRNCDLDLSSWDIAFNGSEPISAATMRRFADAFGRYGFRWSSFFPCYGLAEATLFVSGGPRGTGPYVRPIRERYAPADLPTLAAEPVERSSSGLVPDGVEVRVVNPETLTECASGNVGELWVRSASCGTGYWGIPEESTRTFHACLEPSKEGPFLRTGDLGTICDGHIFVTGRIKDLVIIRGTNHYPQDIELTVQSSHPAFEQCLGAVFSIDGSQGEELVVVQEIDRHMADHAQEALMQARSQIAAKHGLQIFEILALQQGSVPKTTSGKLQRWAAKDAYLQNALIPVCRWQRPV